MRLPVCETRESACRPLNDGSIERVTSLVTKGEIISHLVKRQTAFDVAELLPKTEAKGPIMTTVFRQLAAYNSWANARLFDAALELPEELYRADVGVFFRSLHGTLNSNRQVMAD